VNQDRYLIHPAGEGPIAVQIKRDRRLKKMVRWMKLPDGDILLRVPYGIKQATIARILGGIEQELGHQRRRSARRTDADLQARAEHLNRTHFRGAIRWAAIRWVSNMKKRLGSCSSGGVMDGHIRISTRIRQWPQWVIDYVIAHELAHRVYPDHSREFWEYLRAAYPLTERARGFIQGVGFARNETWEEDEP